MALEAADRVGWGHPRAVVQDLDQGAAGIREVHIDAGGPCIYRVLHELLDGACGALDYFSGRDLVRNVRRQHLDLVGHLRKPLRTPSKFWASTHSRPLKASQTKPTMMSRDRSRA